MTDRELLEMAAKAAGLTKYSEWADQIRDHDSPHYMSWALYRAGVGGQADSWNPLIDDGDALRLAVKLGLRVYTPDDGDDIAVVRNYSGLHVQEMGEDHNKITRRAIVRAAAEIGRGME